MVKIGRRFFFNQSFQKKQRRITIITIAVIVLAIIIVFGATSFFHDSSGERGKNSYELKSQIDVEVFTKMPSFLNFFSKLENIPIDTIGITYPDNFTYDENGDNCTDEEIELIKSIRNGREKAPSGTDPYACLTFVPNTVGSYSVKVSIGKEQETIQLNIVDTTPPEFEVHDLIINNEESYSPEKFVASCDDNSKTDCHFSFYVPLRGEIIDYSAFKDPGEYKVKVVAKDNSDNASEPKEVNLIITEVQYYTITFNSNGGTSVEPQIIREGDTRQLYLPYPSKDGYTFEGWYKGNTKFDGKETITSNITLTAKWKKNSSGGSSGYSGGGRGYSGGGSGRSGGGSSSGCSYGKYSDYSRSVSLYANVLTGQSLSGCANQNNKDDYNEIRSIAYEIALDLTERNVGAIDIATQKMVGSSVNIKHQIHTTQIVNGSNGLVGVLVEIDSSVNGQVIATYTLYDCTLSSCKFK